MWSTSLSSAVAVLSTLQMPTQHAGELARADEMFKDIAATLTAAEQTAKPEDLLPKLSRLEESLAKIDLKLRYFMGGNNSIRHWIGTYTHGSTKLTALFEENNHGKSYSGIDLRLSQIRMIYSEGEQRTRHSIIFYGANNSYLGYTDQSSIQSERAMYGGMKLSKDLSLDAGFVSNGDSKVRILHDSKAGQVSAAVGRNHNDRTVGSISLNDTRHWLSVQGGQSMPTSYRFTMGSIDKMRSQRAFGFTDGGTYEPLPNAATYRFSIGEEPAFHLARRVPGQFLGNKPGDTAFDILYSPNSSVDFSSGVRLPSFGDFKSPYIGGRFVRNITQRTNTFGVEFGGTLKGNEIRGRIECLEKGQLRFGVLFTTQIR